MSTKWRVERCGCDYAWRAFPLDRPYMSRLFESWHDAMEHVARMLEAYADLTFPEPQYW